MIIKLKCRIDKGWRKDLNFFKFVDGRWLFLLIDVWAENRFILVYEGINFNLDRLKKWSWK